MFVLAIEIGTRDKLFKFMISHKVSCVYTRFKDRADHQGLIVCKLRVTVRVIMVLITKKYTPTDTRCVSLCSLHPTYYNSFFNSLSNLHT